MKRAACKEDLMELQRKIDAAFDMSKSLPKRFAISGSYDEREINAEFRDLPTSPNKLEVIRRNKNALHALTDRALIAVLPYYISFGIEHTDTGIMDHVIFFFTANRDNETRLLGIVRRLNNAQVMAISDAIRIFRDSTWASIPEFVEQANAALSSIDSLQARGIHKRPGKSTVSGSN